MTRTLALAALLLLSAPTYAEAQSGPIERIIDGNIFEVAGETIRLWGIDAPEADDGACTEPAHMAAMRLLVYQLSGEPLSCRLPRNGQDRDRYGRLVRVCWLGEIDIAADLVASGRAFDWPRYSDGAYASFQEAAREAGVGVWADDSCRPDWWEGD